MTRTRRKLTPRKIARAEAALLDLLACEDLPDQYGDEYGSVRSEIERVHMESIAPLMRLFWKDEGDR